MESPGVLVPVVAAVYEFVIKGRKRLGYRVQMDTTVTDVVQSEHADGSGGATFAPPEVIGGIKGGRIVGCRAVPAVCRPA